MSRNNSRKLSCWNQSAGKARSWAMKSPKARSFSFRSGTTGYKKGVRLTLDQLRRHAENYNQVMRLSEQDTIVSWLPLYHDMGFIACFVMPLLLRVRVVMLDPMAWVKKPESLFAAIRKHRGTVCYMPNFGFEVMSRQANAPEPGTMRLWISCSEPSYVQTLEGFCRRTGALKETVATCYAMAENVFAMTQSQGLETVDHDGRRVVSCGRAIPGTQVKVVDGELWIKSDTSLHAYVGGEDVRDAEGYYATGDLGALVDGAVAVLGRKRDVMISAGKKYFLNDLDAALGRLLPESAGRIASVADYNTELGTETVIFLVERSRFWDTNDLSSLAEKVKAETGLESFQIHFLPPSFITKTSSGKINRKKTLADWKACQEWNGGRKAGSLEKANPSESFRARVSAAFSSLPVNEPLGRALDSLGTVILRLICEDHGLTFNPELTLEQTAEQLNHAAADKQEKVFSIVALVDGIKLGFGTDTGGFLSEEFIAKLSAEVGMPVVVEHMCVPPVQVLFSDTVFHDYFMPRELGEKYKSFSTVIQKIKSASLVLVDDEDALRLRDLCVYPKLSHRFNSDPDAELLGHRLATYTLHHDELAREVVPGKDLLPQTVTGSLRSFEAYLGRPVMKLAFHEDFAAYTKDWDYTQYRRYVSDADYQRNPVRANEIQGAILDFIRRRRIEMPPTTGTPAKRLVLKEPPHFCSFLINRKAVDYILAQYQSFCIGGLPSSVPYIERQLKAQGKKYFYTSSTNPERTDYECLLLTGLSGAVNGTKPYFDFLQVGHDGGKPHNVSPEVAKACPNLVAGDPGLIDAFRDTHGDLVPIGNWVLNCEASLRPALSKLQPPFGGTVVIYGPVYERSGFGLMGRDWALALHQAGLRVKVVPVDCADAKLGGDVDDCNLYLLRQLELTEARPPVTAICCYVPIYVWPRMLLPEPNVRILLTTYDSNARAMSPPARLVHIGNQMDQTWLATPSEVEAWVRGGAKAELLRTFHWPSGWLDNPIVGPAKPKERQPGKPFRFLHISVFFPRRRLDVLLQAFFEEFLAAEEAELYLKISYPSWHPVKGKPKADLSALIERLRRQTGSKARVTVDESKGTRKELVQLFDSCDFYVSADTTSTAPVSEALFRGRLGIITDGWNVDLPPEMIVVKNSTRQVQITPELAEYMPHHKGGSFPALEVTDMRAALRQAYAMPAAEAAEKAKRALQFMHERFSYQATAPAAIQAITEAWQAKWSTVRVAAAAVKEVPAVQPPAPKPQNIGWCGLQLFHGKVPSLNRGLCLELMKRGHQLSLHPSNGPFQIDELPLETRPEYRQLADRFYAPFKGSLEVNVSSRWHPIFQERAAARQVLVSTWWAGATPEEWTRRIQQHVDEVWVPSRHVRNNFLLGGVPEDKVWVTPVGVDAGLFSPQAAPLPLQTKKSFKFLFVGETSPRKGLDLLLKAYLSAFSRRDDVCLVIKDIDCEDYYWRRASAEMVRECRANPEFAEIEYLDKMLSEADLASLYTACDCFVQPFRTASFPLAALEAMACGLPVITTGYGGALDVCDEQVTYLLKAHEQKHHRDYVGHWRVTGPQMHAEVEIGQLKDRMRHVFNHPAEAKARGAAARAKVCAGFTWEKQATLVQERLAQVCEKPANRSQETASPKTSAQTMPAKLCDALPWLGLKKAVGSVLFFAPFYNRSGFGTSARAAVAGLQAAGMRVRIVPVDNVETGIDDCDMAGLKALEKTPLTAPVAAIFFHVPSQNWAKLPLPDGSVRVMYTTFDSSAQGNKPPAAWMEVFRAMDQVWLMSESEAEVFHQAGVPRQKLQVVPCPHSWINNAVLPPPTEPPAPAETFRFLSIAMYQPRRRWDTLVEAFLAEFQNEPRAELYLKVNYPGWHPVPGQPKRDLAQLVENLRRKTGSKARVTIDDDLGTRTDICRLIDGCQVYVSTDTASTAPVSESFVRGRVVVMPDGYGANLPYAESSLIIPVDPNLKGEMTPKMLAYQPHHRGTKMPLLRVEDVRRVLRAAFELPAEKRAAMGQHGSLFMETNFGPTYAVRKFIRAVHKAFEAKFPELDLVAPLPGEAPKGPRASGGISVAWQGSFLDLGSLSHVNREMTRHLAGTADIKLARVGTSALVNGFAKVPELQALAEKLIPKAPENVQVTIQHAWPPDWRRPASGKFVVMQPWEFGSLPAEWVAKLGQVDEFWAYSDYVRKVYIQSGVPAEKVKVVPLGFDSQRFHPQVPPLSLATKKSFKFLFVGGTIHRKGPDVLLEAYLRTFTAQDDVCLVVKDFGGQSVYAGQTLEARIKAAQAQPNTPEILYLNCELASEELPGLYAACQCLAHPYRGEGFGLPILEAMACGLPVIVTSGGAADDFAREEVSYRIPAKQKVFGDSVSGMKLAKPGWLLEPDAEALAARMKWVLEHQAEARDKGKRGAEFVHREFTWERSAQAAAERLRELGSQVSAARSSTAAARKQLAERVAARRKAPLTLPPCALIGQVAKARQLLANRKTREAWEATLGSIQARPHHPEAYLLLAEIAFAVGDSQSARLCAEHSRRIAPGYKPAKQFLNRRLKGGARAEWLRLPETVQNPKAESRSRLTVCLIAKNEEKFLGQCLASVRGLAEQIVVVDTGFDGPDGRDCQGTRSRGVPFCVVRRFQRGAERGVGTRDGRLGINARRGRGAIPGRAEEAEGAHGGRAGHGLAAADHRCGPGSRRLFVCAAAVPECAGLILRWPRTRTGVQQPGSPPGRMGSGESDWRGGVDPSRLYGGDDEGPEEGGAEPGVAGAGGGRAAGRTEPVDEPGFGIIASGPRIRSVGALSSGFRGDGNEKRLGDYAGVEGNLAFPILQPLAGRQTVGRSHPSARFTGCRERGRVECVAAFYPGPGADGVGKPERSRGADAAMPGQAQTAQSGANQQRDFNRRALPLSGVMPTATRRHCRAETAFKQALQEPAKREAVGLDYAKFLAGQNRAVEALHVLHEAVTQAAGNAAAWRLGGEIALSRAEFLEFAGDWTGEAIQQVPEDLTIANQRAQALLLNQNTAGALAVWERVCAKERQATALAGLIFCQVLEGKPARELESEAEKAEVTRAFIGWCQKCLAGRAAKLVGRLGERLEDLRRVLPQAAEMMEAAFGEAKGETAREVCVA